MTEKWSPTPKEYLDAKIEPKLPRGNERNMGRRLESILDSPVSFEYSEETGTFESDPSDSKVVAFNYCKISDDTVQLFADQITALGAKVDSYTAKALKDFLIPCVVLINNYQLRNQETDHILDVQKDIQECQQEFLLLQPTSRFSEGFGINKMILSAGNPWELATLLNIYHEMNHPETPYNGIPITVDEAGSDLKAERDAWSFALRKLRPFLDKDQRAFAESYVHESLGGHSDAMRKTIAPEIVVKIFRPLQQFLASKINKGV